jgi:hypothetical protein
VIEDFKEALPLIFVCISITDSARERTDFGEHINRLGRTQRFRQVEPAGHLSAGSYPANIR